MVDTFSFWLGYFIALLMYLTVNLITTYALKRKKK